MERNGYNVMWDRYSLTFFVSSHLLQLADVIRLSSSCGSGTLYDVLYTSCAVISMEQMHLTDLHCPFRT